MTAARLAGPRRTLALAAITSALSAVVSPPVRVAAQTAALEGFVLSSSTGRRLAGVLVVVESGPRTRSDHEGAYRLEGIEPGERRVALVAPGCQITMATVGLWPGEQKSLAFEVAFDPEVGERLALRRRSIGKVVSAAEIEAMRPTTLMDVIARVAPGMVRSLPPQPGMDPVARSRSAVDVRGSVAPAVILDGTLLGSSGFRALQDVLPSDVAWLEVAGGAAGGWEVGTGGSGGLLRIQTKRGRDADALLTDPERCEIPGWANPISGSDYP